MQCGAVLFQMQYTMGLVCFFRDRGAMEESITEIVNWIKAYYGDAYFMLVTLFSYIYIFICTKKWRRSLVYPSILIVACLINPILYIYIFSKTVYWRLLWMYSNVIVVAAAITLLIRKAKKRTAKIFIVLAFIAMIIAKGHNAYTSDAYMKAQNFQRLSPDTIAICDRILADNPHPKCIMPAGFYNEARQYSGDIILAYGRDIEGYIIERKGDRRTLHSYVNNLDYDINRVAFQAREEGVDYIVLSKQECIYELENYGYQYFANVGNYEIFKQAEFDNSAWKLCIERLEDGSVICTIKDSYNRLGMIDGPGWSANEELREYIKENNNVVDDWMITNIKNDYCGAYANIISEDADIRVQSKYIPNIDKEGYVDAIYDNKEISDAQEVLYRLVQYGNPILFDSEFPVQDFLGLKIKVLNNYNPEKSYDKKDLINDSSLVVMFSGAKHSFLYVSNITADSFKEIVNNNPDVQDCKCIIVKSDRIESIAELEKCVEKVMIVDVYQVEHIYSEDIH